MKRFQWRIAICLVPLLGALAYLAPKFYHGKAGFKLGVDLVGGTILVYEAERTELIEGLSDEKKKELMTNLAAKIKRRIDPTDLKNVTVRPVGELRLEIILPLSVKKQDTAVEDKNQSQSLDDVDYIKSLIKEVGSLEFRFLANDRDDQEALTAAEDFFKSAATDKTKAELLDKLAREGNPPPPPETPANSFLELPNGQKHPVFKTERGNLTYSWVELGKGQRLDNNLDNEAEKSPARSPNWTQAKDSREKGLPFRLSVSNQNNALFFSREIKDVSGKTSEQERKEKKVEYFVLTRDPERDPLTGELATVSGQYITKAEEDRDEQGRPSVSFQFDNKGAGLFQDVTSKNIPDRSGFKRHLAIILDGKMESAPTLNSAIGSRGQISGRFTQKDVTKLVNILRAGALPTTLKPQPVSEQTMGPTLGEVTIRRGQTAVGLAFAAVLVFMCVYYRFAGAVASFALLANLILTVAAMVMVNATFTLPGLAGLVLMLGMAVDANVLIYERLREERERGATLALALRNGYDRALPTIIDTHLTSIFTAIVLWAIGNDQLKGFGISLTIGLIISLFTSLYVTRVIFDLWTHLQLLKNLSMARWVPHTKIDFMAIRNYWFTATIILTVLGLGLFLYRGERSLNVDFTGGVAYTGRLEKPLDITVLHELLDQKKADVQQRLIVESIEPVDPVNGKSRNFLVTYRGEKVPHRVNLANPTTREDLGERIEHLPDLSLEMIYVSADEGGGQSRVFTARTSEQYYEVVRIVINRLLSDNKENKNLKRIRMESFKIDDNAKGATLQFDDEASPAQVKLLLRNELKGLGLEDISKTFEVVALDPGEGGRSKILQVGLTQAVDIGKLKEALDATRREFANHPQPERLEVFDTTLAGETQLRALYAVLASWAAILMYLWFRFGSWTFGLAAVLCLVHDLLFTLGIIAACHYLTRWMPGLAATLDIQDFKIDFATIAALLTLVGYSVNDTIVVFDRIREVRGKNPQLTPQMINDSVNQTLSRTLLTSFITWLVVLVLYIWGGEGVHLFAFVMVVGVIVGTYSSIYIASPLLLIFGEGKKAANVRERQPALSPQGAAV